jgi:hypothetical protein
MKTAFFWDATVCSLVDIDCYFRGAYCPHHQSDDGGNIHQTKKLRSQPFYTKNKLEVLIPILEVPYLQTTSTLKCSDVS